MKKKENIQRIILRHLLMSIVYVGLSMVFTTYTFARICGDLDPGGGCGVTVACNDPGCEPGGGPTSAPTSAPAPTSRPPQSTPRPTARPNTPRPSTSQNTLAPTAAPTSPPAATNTPSGGSFSCGPGCVEDLPGHCSCGGSVSSCVKDTCHALTSTSGCGNGAYLKVCASGAGASRYVCVYDLATVNCSHGNFCDTYTPNQVPVPWIDTILDLTNTKKQNGKDVPDPIGRLTWGEVPDIPGYNVNIQDLTDPSLAVKPKFPQTHGTWVTVNGKDKKDKFQEIWNLVLDGAGNPHVYKATVVPVDVCGNSNPTPITTSTIKARIQGLLISCPTTAGVSINGSDFNNGSMALSAAGTNMKYSTGDVLNVSNPYTVKLTGVSGYTTEVSSVYNSTDHSAGFVNAGGATVSAQPSVASGQSAFYVDVWWRCSPTGATPTPTDTTVPPGTTSTPTPPPAATATPVPGLYLELAAAGGIVNHGGHLISIDKKQYDLDVPMTLTNNGVTLSGVTLAQIGNNGAPDTYTTISLPTVPATLIPGQSVSVIAHLTAVMNVGASGTFGIKFKASGHDSAAAPNSVTSLYAPVNQTLDGPSVAWVQLADSSYYHPAPNPVSSLRSPIPHAGGSISIDGWPLSYPPAFNFGKTGLSTVNPGAGTVDFTPKTPGVVLSPWKDDYTRSAGHTVDSYIGKIIASGKAQKVGSASDIRVSGLYLVNSDIDLDTFDRPNTNIVIIVNGNATIKSTGGGGGVFGSPGSSLAILAKGITIDDSVLRAYGFLWGSSVTSKFTSNTLLVKGNLISDTGWSEVPRNADSAAPTILIEFDPLSYMKLNRYLGVVRVESR